MEFRKNDLVTLEIEDCGIDGEGIGKADGFTVFVKDAVIGDKVTAKYTIKNASPDLTAKLTVNDPVVENTTYFKATKTVTGLAENNTMELAKDATVEVELTVELIKTPVTDDPVATTVNMSINADPVQP